jgi:hypothetical protein
MSKKEPEKQMEKRMIMPADGFAEKFGTITESSLAKLAQLTQESITRNFIKFNLEETQKLERKAAVNYTIQGDVYGETTQTPVSKAPILYIDPLFDPMLFLFPKDRIDEINKRLRHYYETNPIVGSAIDLHVSVPITDFVLECTDKNNQKYWNDWKDRVGLIEMLRQLIHDYWLLGEGIALPIWDKYTLEISHFNQYPPENVEIVQTYVSPTKLFFLKPDPNLIKKINSNNPADKELVNLMSPDFVKALRKNALYPLGDSSTVIYLARISTKYKSRGTSILMRCLKDLLYMDKLRLLQITFVDRHLFPLKIFKLGSEQHGWIPSKAHFMKLKEVLAQNQSDPSFGIIWNFALNVDYVGTKDKIANLIPEFEFAIKQIMAGLFVNEEIIHGGIPSSVRDTVSMRVLMQRYNDVREKIERILITHVFLPMARNRKLFKKDAIENIKNWERKASTLYEKQTGKKVRGDKPVPFEYFIKANYGELDISAFDIPRPIWKRINIFNNLSEQQYLMTLEEQGKFPLSMLLEYFGIDPETVMRKLKEEESTIFDKVYREIRSEFGKSDPIRLRILNGEKVSEWIKNTKKDKGGTITPKPEEGLFGGGLGGGGLPPIPPIGEFVESAPPPASELGPMEEIGGGGGGEIGGGEVPSPGGIE